MRVRGLKLFIAREFLLGEYRIPTWDARIEMQVRQTAKKRLVYSLFF
jgi:hypothetical protein